MIVGEISKEELELLKGKIENILETELLAAKNAKVELTVEEIYDIHEEGLKHLLMLYINNIDKFKEYREKNLDDIVTKSVERFKKGYNFHRKMLKCDNFDHVKESTVTIEQLKDIKEVVNERIEKFFYSMKKEFCKLSLEQNKEMHFFVLNTIVDLDVKHVPCFREAAKKMDLKRVLNIHRRQFDDVFMKYYK